MIGPDTKIGSGLRRHPLKSSLPSIVATRPPAARLWPQASRRAADGLAGSVAHARAPGAHNVRVTNPPQTATLETKICGQRLSTARAANEPRRRPKRLSRPTDAAASRGNVVLFCGVGNHVNLRRLPGGAEGIRTSNLRRAPARWTTVPPSIRRRFAAKDAPPFRIRI
jgi:hypothetical protein